MRFVSYFEPDFLVNEHISLKNVICNEQNKTFDIYLEGARLLDVVAFKKLVSGIQKISSLREFRKYSVVFHVEYADLRVNEEKLYLDYFRIILTEVNVDYELLTLSNHNVTYKDGKYTLNLNDTNKVSDRAIEKAIKLFVFSFYAP